MNKQNRGDAPKPEKVAFAHYDPVHGVKEQGGFEQDNIKSGNLRQHNGRAVDDAKFTSTAHYDGDFGIPGGTGTVGVGIQGGSTGSGGSSSGSRGGSSSGSRMGGSIGGGGQGSGPVSGSSGWGSGGSATGNANVGSGKGVRSKRSK